VISDYLRANASASNRAKTHYLGQNLQICFINDAIKDEENDEEEEEESDELEQQRHADDAESIPVFENGEGSNCEQDEEVLRTSSKTKRSSNSGNNKKKHQNVPVSLSNFAIDFTMANDSWNTILAQLQV
jgi:hypothetical protein